MIRCFRIISFVFDNKEKWFSLSPVKEVKDVGVKNSTNEWWASSDSEKSLKQAQHL